MEYKKKNNKQRLEQKLASVKSLRGSYIGSEKSQDFFILYACLWTIRFRNRLLFCIIQERVKLVFHLYRTTCFYLWAHALIIQLMSSTRGKSIWRKFILFIPKMSGNIKWFHLFPGAKLANLSTQSDKEFHKQMGVRFAHIKWYIPSRKNTLPWGTASVGWCQASTRTYTQVRRPCPCLGSTLTLQCELKNSQPWPQIHGKCKDENMCLILDKS